jgi:hypothetical protein
MLPSRPPLTHPPTCSHPPNHISLTRGLPAHRRCCHRSYRDDNFDGTNLPNQPGAFAQPGKLSTAIHACAVLHSEPARAHTHPHTHTHTHTYTRALTRSSTHTHSRVHNRSVDNVHHRCRVRCLLLRRTRVQGVHHQRRHGRTRLLSQVGHHAQAQPGCSERHHQRNLPAYTTTSAPTNPWSPVPQRRDRLRLRQHWQDRHDGTSASVRQSRVRQHRASRTSAPSDGVLPRLRHH